MAKPTTYVVQVSKGTSVPPDASWRPSLKATTVYVGASQERIQAAQGAAINTLMAAGVAVHCQGVVFSPVDAPIGYAIVTISKAGV
jgi:hypothetical protein